MMTRSLLLLLFAGAVLGNHPACNYKGYLEHVTKRCICASGYHGPTCSLKYCPFGIAWTDIPTAQDRAHTRKTECSNMGICDRSKGTCKCRAGFEGPACERLWCPRTLGVDCSGHGRCMSLSQAGAEWDGERLFRDPKRKTYDDPWDAKKLHGCVCDEGWTSYDCSQRRCLMGYDGVKANPKHETLVISCQADQGHFSLFKNSVVIRVPFDATASDLQQLLQGALPIQSASVEILSPGYFVCGDDAAVFTRVTLVGDFGSPTIARISAVVPNLPELFTSKATALSLELSAGAGQVALGTEFVLQCEACATCSGPFFFDYNGDITEGLDAFGASPEELQLSLQELTSINRRSEFGNLTVEVTSTHARLCDATEDVTTTIILFGAYANVGDLTFINSVRVSPLVERSTVDDSKIAATLTSPHRQASLTECSGGGTCDRSSAQCQCFVQKNVFNNTIDDLYLFQSSNGYGEPGSRPDCGYTRTLPSDCISNCNDNGVCELSETGRYHCVCAAGFTGASCAERACPTAAPWFAEPSQTNNAHVANAIECGGMGQCDRQSGRCRCREGFFGSACQYLDCPLDSFRNRCSGHGQCLSLRQLAAYSQTKDGAPLDINYGVDEYNAWDADRIFGCMCDNRNYMQPSNGPITTINGLEVNNPTLYGYHGFDCSLRHCPVGDDPFSPGKFEVQEVTCDPQANTTYSLQFRGETTEPISANASVQDIEIALNQLRTIGNVSVSYSTDLHTSYRVTFLTEFGAIPLLSSPDSPMIFVNKTAPGTKQALECAGRGVCDYSTGLCSCLSTWHSSDGDRNLGQRGDCGYVDPYGH